VATVLIMAFLNPASAQATPMPEIEVFDIYGSYSGQTTVVMTFLFGLELMQAKQ
jgi:hypothetical protein